ncbi:hypothetical protein PPACK8108_LOCUS14078 [Phakopsora pachyrhizi]|uniref:Uncharacterized protein n=1 Tax=Phakopsora pachyrhizi TaxID=170000 RepID=A0AAV0B7L2_PHAPC|nr:hypothetical protein PPACK8108_LOCUS14078 [Phakopsora pachyrhizi]
MERRRKRTEVTYLLARVDPYVQFKDWTPKYSKNVKQELGNEFSCFAKLKFEIDSDEAEDVASYRISYNYNCSDNQINTRYLINPAIILPAEVDSALRGSSLTTPGSKEQTVADEDSFITIRAVNKFESRSQGSHDASNWRAKFRSQHRAFLAKEINK